MHALGHPLRLLAALQVLRLELGALLLEARQVLLAGADRLALRQEEVAGVAGADPHHLAHLPELVHALHQDEFDHRSGPFVKWKAARGRAAGTGRTGRAPRGPAPSPAGTTPAARRTAPASAPAPGVPSPARGRRRCPSPAAAPGAAAAPRPAPRPLPRARPGTAPRPA